MVWLICRFGERERGMADGCFGDRFVIYGGEGLVW